MPRHKSCERNERCTQDECNPPDCDNYKYNHKRYVTENEMIERKLTDEELVAVGEELVAARAVIDEADEQLAFDKKRHKRTVSEQEKIVSDCVTIMKNKSESVSTPVESCFNYVDGTLTKTYLNSDKEEITLLERDLTPEETQDEIDLFMEENEVVEDEYTDPDFQLCETPEASPEPEEEEAADDEEEQEQD